MKGAFGLPKPISVKPTDDGERYFHRHVIFHDHPGALDETDGATGILQPRFIGKV
jgi:hypothetical protein